MGRSLGGAGTLATAGARDHLCFKQADRLASWFTLCALGRQVCIAPRQASKLALQGGQEAPQLLAEALQPWPWRWLCQRNTEKTGPREWHPIAPAHLRLVKLHGTGGARRQGTWALDCACRRRMHVQHHEWCTLMRLPNHKTCSASHRGTRCTHPPAWCSPLQTTC